MKEKKAAIKAAKEAGKIMLKYFNRKRISFSYKGQVELLTEADILCERKIKEILTAELPTHNFLGEEGGKTIGSSEFTWVVDPVDGTNNFAHKYPWFCTSIALTENNEPILGVVYNPLSRELFYSEKGKGTFLNNKRIAVSKNAKLRESLVETGFPYRNMELIEKNIQNIRNLIGKVAGVRRSGSAAYEMCLIASGQLEAFFCYTLKPWDVAAAKLIIEEAGGMVTNFKGKECNIFAEHFVASNSLVHKELLKYLGVP